MQTFTFLSALPALLGLAGFVLYQVLGANRAGDDISKRIIEKLRNGLSGDVPPDKRLTPKQVGHLLEQQQHLQKIAGEQDFQLLKQALTQQFVVTVLVYVLSLAFCSWSVYLFVQSPALAQKASPMPVQNQVSAGNHSPNVISSGSGAVNVTNSDQSKTMPEPAKLRHKK